MLGRWQFQVLESQEIPFSVVTLSQPCYAFYDVSYILPHLKVRHIPTKKSRNIKDCTKKVTFSISHFLKA